MKFSRTSVEIWRALPVLTFGALSIATGIAAVVGTFDSGFDEAEARAMDVAFFQGMTQTPQGASGKDGAAGQGTQGSGEGGSFGELFSQGMDRAQGLDGEGAARRGHVRAIASQTSRPSTVSSSASEESADRQESRSKEQTTSLVGHPGPDSAAPKVEAPAPKTMARAAVETADLVATTKSEAPAEEVAPAPKKELAESEEPALQDQAAVRAHRPPVSRLRVAQAEEILRSEGGLFGRGGRHFEGLDPERLFVGEDTLAGLTPAARQVIRREASEAFGDMGVLSVEQIYSKALGHEGFGSLEEGQLESLYRGQSVRGDRGRAAYESTDLFSTMRAALSTAMKTPESRLDVLEPAQALNIEPPELKVSGGPPELTAGLEARMSRLGTGRTPDILPASRRMTLRAEEAVEQPATRTTNAPAPQLSIPQPSEEAADARPSEASASTMAGTFESRVPLEASPAVGSAAVETGRVAPVDHRASNGAPSQASASPEGLKDGFYQLEAPERRMALNDSKGVATQVSLGDEPSATRAEVKDPAWAATQASGRPETRSQASFSSEPSVTRAEVKDPAWVATQASGRPETRSQASFGSEPSATRAEVRDPAWVATQASSRPETRSQTSFGSEADVSPSATQTRQPQWGATGADPRPDLASRASFDRLDASGLEQQAQPAVEGRSRPRPQRSDMFSKLNERFDAPSREESTRSLSRDGSGLEEGRRSAPVARNQGIRMVEASTEDSGFTRNQPAERKAQGLRPESDESRRLTPLPREQGVRRVEAGTERTRTEMADPLQRRVTARVPEQVESRQTEWQGRTGDAPLRSVQRASAGLGSAGQAPVREGRMVEPKLNLRRQGASGSEPSPSRVRRDTAQGSFVAEGEGESLLAQDGRRVEAVDGVESLLVERDALSGVTQPLPSGVTSRPGGDAAVTGMSEGRSVEAAQRSMTAAVDVVRRVQAQIERMGSRLRGQKAESVRFAAKTSEGDTVQVTLQVRKSRVQVSLDATGTGLVQGLEAVRGELAARLEQRGFVLDDYEVHEDRENREQKDGRNRSGSERGSGRRRGEQDADSRDSWKRKHGTLFDPDGITG